MFPMLAPNDLYRDYEAHVAEHLLKQSRLAEARAAQGYQAPAWQMVRRWLATVRVRLVWKLQPSEEGYIA